LSGDNLRRATLQQGVCVSSCTKIMFAMHNRCCVLLHQQNHSQARCHPDNSIWFSLILSSGCTATKCPAATTVVRHW
jgi:hypothetical protein